MTRPQRLAVDCPSGKVTFPSKAKANKWIRHLPFPHSLDTYTCPHCGHWHTTTRRAR